MYTENKPKKIIITESESDKRGIKIILHASVREKKRKNERKKEPWGLSFWRGLLLGPIPTPTRIIRFFKIDDL